MRFSLLFLNYIYKIGFWLILVLFAADLLVFFYYPNTIFGSIFLATKEQTPLTWFSSLAMFFVAISSFSVYFETKEKIWYFLSMIFFFFSMDDAIYLHERLSGFFANNTAMLNFFPAYIWVVLYAPILLFALGAIIYLLWKNSNKLTKKFVATSIILLGLAIFLDFLDGFVQKKPSLVFCLQERCNIITFHLIRLIEEILEVLALGILGYINIKKHCLYNSEK